MDISEIHALTMMIQYPEKAFEHVCSFPDEVFENNITRVAFAAYKRLMREHTVVDFVTIRNALVAFGISEEDATLWYLEHAQHNVVFFNPVIFAQLYEAYKMRSLKMFAYKVIDNYFSTYQEAHDEISSLIHDNTDNSKLVYTLDEISLDNSKRIAFRSNVEVIDAHLHSFFGGQLICIAGRPSMGKSSLALQIAKEMSRAKFNVYFASLESTAHEILHRLIASETGIPVYDILTDNLSSMQKTIINDTYVCLKSQLSSLKIIQKYTLDDILYIVRSDKSQNVTLIIDYLQIMHAAKKRSRVEEIAEITRALKLFAMERCIPVILLSQLNRDADGNVPKLSDLRDSGTIEQDSDIVIFIHKDDKRSSKAKLIFAKARDAATNFVEVYHDVQAYSFYPQNNTILI